MLKADGLPNCVRLAFFDAETARTPVKVSPWLDYSLAEGAMLLAIGSACQAKSSRWRNRGSEAAATTGLAAVDLLTGVRLP